VKHRSDGRLVLVLAGSSCISLCWQPAVSVVAETEEARNCTFLTVQPREVSHRCIFTIMHLLYLHSSNMIKYIFIICYWQSFIILCIFYCYFTDFFIVSCY